MTKKYPLLTIEKVNYWYWECEPHWSQIDIANEVGCSVSLVSNFMINKGILTRNPSEANLTRYRCPHKLENHVETMNQEKVKNSISDRLQELWRVLDFRTRVTKAQQENAESIIGFTQFMILKAVYGRTKETISDLANNPLLRSFTTSQLDSALRRLFKRGFLTRERDKFSKIKRYYYSITERGKKAYNVNDNEETITKLKKWQEINRTTASTRIFPKLGKIQLKILSLIELKGPLFFSEIVSELKKDSISQEGIMSSINKMIKNKFLFRAKKYNKNLKKNNRLEFKYSLDNFIEGFQEHHKRLGAVQFNILTSLISSNGYFLRELAAKDNLKDFSKATIGIVLGRLCEDRLVERVKKKDIASKSKNRMKYFYAITKLGDKTLELVS